jgi:hypothetical protein
LLDLYVSLRKSGSLVRSYLVVDSADRITDRFFSRQGVRLRALVSRPTALAASIPANVI